VLPGGRVVTLPSAAPAARDRKSAKTDAKRREGTALRQAVTPSSPSSGGAPAPSGQAAPPQLGTAPPPPQMENTPFAAAQYKKPSNALEYLAAGLALLFPGSAIGQAGGALAKGLNTGAEQGYQRREDQAKEQYTAQQNAANVTYENAKAAYDAGLAEQQRAFANAKIVWDNNAALRSKGLNPLKVGPDGQPTPFRYPTLGQATPKVPKGGDQTAATMAGYDRLIQLAARNGDDGAVTRYTTEQKDYQQTALQTQKDVAAWQKVLVTQQQENARAAAGIGARYAAIGAANARTSAEIGSREVLENQREHFEVWHDQFKAALGDPQKKLQLQAEATRGTQTLATDLRELTVPHGTMPPAISFGSADWQTLQKAMMSIRNSSDPQTFAKHLIADTKNVNFQNLFQQAGDVYALQHTANGRQIKPDMSIPNAYGLGANLPKGSSGAPLFHYDLKIPAVKAGYDKAKAAGLNLDDPQVHAAIVHDAGLGGATPSLPTVPVPPTARGL